MKIIITEGQLHRVLLSETPMEFLRGLKPDVAEFIHNISGEFTIWVTSAIFSSIINELEKKYHHQKTFTRQDALNVINNDKYFIFKWKNVLPKIIKYVKIGLKGDIEEIKHLSIDEIVNLANNWISDRNKQNKIGNI